MALVLSNTYSRSREPFVPLDPAGREVLLYSCGPTVYSYAHIGNFRSFLVADLLARTLRRRGYQVRHVMNITDVGHMTEDHLADATGEDKLAKAARELGWDPFQVARHYEDAFVADAARLRLSNYQGDRGQVAALHPRATDFIPEMLAAIQLLIERGFAYVDDVGQAYFEISKFPEYGRLSGKPIDELEAGARVEVRAEKRDPRDFALWKVDPKHLMQWDPHGPDGWRGDDRARLDALVPGGVDRRLGRGFPGWHIECSAMARACLAPVIDLHTGGEDNVFPHHECEIAQCFGAYGTTVTGPDGDERPTFARTWVHGRHLLVNGRKMSKRDGTFYTVRDVIDPRGNGRPELADQLVALGFSSGRVPAPVLRWALMSTHHASLLNFSFDVLASARSAVERLQSCHQRLRELEDSGDASAAPSPEVAAAIAGCRDRFDAGLDDDLDIAAAHAATLELVAALNTLPLTPADAAAARAALEALDEVLDVLDRRRRAGIVSKAALATWRDSHPLADEAALVALTEIDEAAVLAILAARDQARRDRDFALADRLRGLLQQRGVAIDDTPAGTRWRLPEEDPS